MDVYVAGSSAERAATEAGSEDLSATEMQAKLVLAARESACSEKMV